MDATRPPAAWLARRARTLVHEAANRCSDTYDTLTILKLKPSSRLVTLTCAGTILPLRSWIPSLRAGGLNNESIDSDHGCRIADRSGSCAGTGRVQGEPRA